jgi:hypothetical protein
MSPKQKRSAAINMQNDQRAARHGVLNNLQNSAEGFGGTCRDETPP